MLRHIHTNVTQNTEQPEPLSQNEQTRSMFSLGTQAQPADEEHLTGKVYKLTVLDAVRAIVSSQVDGDILLTVPVYQTTSPFITISISDKLLKQFVSKSPRIM